MSVTGWTKSSGSPSWSGSEASSIYRGDGSSADPCILTRDANGILTDFTSEHYLVNSNDSSQLGGLVFAFTDSANFYFVVLDTIPGNKIRLIKNESKWDANASNIIDEQYCPAIIQNGRIKVVKSGSNIKVYASPNDNDSSYTLYLDVNDTTHSSGKIGFGYPSDVWSGSNTGFYYRSITGGSTPTSRKQIFSIT